MPYIKQDRRDAIDGGEPPNDVGELNYLITTICKRYAYRSGDVRYSVINDVMGVLACVQAEFYRRVAIDYENEKIWANGDVY